MNKKYFKYYIVYTTEGGGIGSLELQRTKKIKTFEDIKIAGNYISKNCCDNKSVMILNDIRIK